MLPLLQNDLRVAVRALEAVPPARRAALCGRMLRLAAAAEARARRTGRPHPRWGAGTLLAVAMRFPLAPEAPWDSPGALASARLLLEKLAERRAATVKKS
jgi:hypothetical protein